MRIATPNRRVITWDYHQFQRSLQANKFSKTGTRGKFPAFTKRPLHNESFWRHRGAVLVIYSAGLLFGTLAVVVSSLSLQRLLIVGVLLALAAVAGIITLERVPYEHQEAV